MARWALIRGAMVWTIVEQDTQPTLPDSIAVDVTGMVVNPGDVWNGATFARSPFLSVSLRDFWQRFTVAEREALQNILATGTQTQKNKLNAFRDYLLQGGNVELNDDYVIASVTLMETAGILGAGRAAAILTP